MRTVVLRTLLEVREAGGKQRVQLVDQLLHGKQALPGPPVALEPLNGRVLAELPNNLRWRRRGVDVGAARRPKEQQLAAHSGTLDGAQAMPRDWGRARVR